ncbi:MAG: hypothetical protein BGO65_04875 [Afipia sp. 64-13]|nr:MAG: hypothetical protein BGO65_04875 [Afipia sp. 64-13]
MAGSVIRRTYDIRLGAGRTGEESRRLSVLVPDVELKRGLTSQVHITERLAEGVKGLTFGFPGSL